MTAQISDDFSMNGAIACLMGCPALPWHHPRLARLTDDEAMKACRDGLIFSTACWRRYVATWRLERDRLYLDAIEGIYRLEGEAPLFADWVTETLRVAQGHELTYVHMGFGTVYERDLLLDVRMGVLVSRSERDNRGQPHDAAALGLENLPSDETVTPGWKRGIH
ncbi:MAG: hypothetical protein AB7L90_09165 [Hyphomicrobiaceae bacterium]